MTLAEFYAGVDVPQFYDIIQGRTKKVTETVRGKTITRQEFTITGHPAFVFQSFRPNGKVEAVMSFDADQMRGEIYSKTTKVVVPEGYKLFIYGNGSKIRN